MQWEHIPPGSNTHIEIFQNFLKNEQETRAFVPQILTLLVNRYSWKAWLCPTSGFALARLCWRSAWVSILVNVPEHRQLSSEKFTQSLGTEIKLVRECAWSQATGSSGEQDSGSWGNREERGCLGRRGRRSISPPRTEGPHNCPNVFCHLWSLRASDIWQEFPVPPLLAPIPLPTPVRVQTGSSNTTLTVRNRYLKNQNLKFWFVNSDNQSPFIANKNMALSLWWNTCSQLCPICLLQLL